MSMRGLELVVSSCAGLVDTAAFADALVAEGGGIRGVGVPDGVDRGKVGVLVDADVEVRAFKPVVIAS